MTSMNQKLLFSLVYCLYVTLVASQSSNSNSTLSNNTSNAECADFFKVSKCSTCQKTAYGALDEHLSNCFALQNVTLTGSNASDSTSLKQKCDLTCDQNAIKTLNENIQRDCQQELTDWATSDSVNDPKYPAPNLWFSVYTAIPNMQALCSQSSDGCNSKIVNFILSLLKPGQSTNINATISPPNGLASYGDPKKTEPLQINIICSDCYSKLAQPWVNFFNMTQPSIPAVKKKLDDYIEPIKGNLTQFKNVS
ncbi:485_t:CDS:2 [Ambispora leptoticha]|uniref:485_t:CDS:1 n=1 Tax=Ambispora leptoticha TaxID=144679 RepID=A0A9N9G640_9GLOM|nr:485_t:CDS:2 [Ambispora leptoticha]